MSAEFYSLPGLSLSDPSGVRRNSQVKRGLTMIIDKGLGIRYFEDLLDTAGEYIDFIKLGFGTAALYPSHILQSKIRLASQFNVDIYPGGTFFEVAFHQNRVHDYFETMKQMGFAKVEISDGTIDLSKKSREESIHFAREYGFEVITEYGKKAEGSSIHMEELVETITNDLAWGASFIIVEGRESGENVGIYDQHGKVFEEFSVLVDRTKEFADRIIWEAPKKNQQVELMGWFGPNVHLGNIAPEDILSVESLRRGLRSDTFFSRMGR